MQLWVMSDVCERRCVTKRCVTAERKEDEEERHTESKHEPHTPHTVAGKKVPNVPSETLLKPRLF